jgi:hypothetical protein
VWGFAVPNRYQELQEKLNTSHVPVIVIDAQGERANALLRRNLTVRQLRDVLMTKFVQDTAKRSNYTLFANGAPLTLAETLESLPAYAEITYKRMERHQPLEDHRLLLVFEDNTLFELDRLPSVLGRKTRQNTDVDIDLSEFPNGDTVSRKHAEISCQDDRYYIRNLSSRSLFVNEIEIMADKYELTDGAVIRLGKIVFRLRIQAREE